MGKGWDKVETRLRQVREKVRGGLVQGWHKVATGWYKVEIGVEQGSDSAGASFRRGWRIAW